MSDEAGAGSETKSNNSSFVEHLRLVHFTLCLTCFIAIIAVAAKSPSSAQRAYEQTNRLLSLQAEWDDGGWLKKIANQRSVQNATFQGSVQAGGFTKTLAFRPISVGPRQWERYPWLAFARTEKDRLVALKPNASVSFTSMEDAEAVWNMLRDLQKVVTPSMVHDGWMMEPKINPQDKFVVEAKLNGGVPVAISSGASSSQASVAGARWFLAADVEDYLTFEGEPFRSAALDLLKNHKADCYFVGLVRDSGGLNGPPRIQALLLFPADCKTEKIDLQRMLGKEILPAAFPVGDFKHSFPDVSDLGKNLRTLKLADLRDYFQAEQDRAGDKIELPLVKLPAESVVYWGTATILVITIYWFVVFRDFARRVRLDDKAWDTPWIGTSREPWSQGLFFVTLLIPPCVAAYLIFYGLGRAFGLELRVLLAFAAFVTVGAPIAGIALAWRKHIQPNFDPKVVKAER
jgi:hypothetical protein